jgi:hypothetical protein
MSRIDLFVAPEDYPQVRALGARWDPQSQCWYTEGTTPDTRFAAWLPAGHFASSSDGFIIESHEACVARAAAPCRSCRRQIEVVCLYCRCGSVSGEPLESFCVQSLWAVDDALYRQLLRWPAYRLDVREGIYLNHCPHCGAGQDEAGLHEESGQPFHDLGREVPEAVTLVALAGRVRMSGDYCVDV